MTRNKILLIDDVINLYYRQHVKPRVADVERTRYALHWLGAYLGRRAVVKLRDSHINGYVNARRKGAVGRPAQDSTIRRELGSLIAALRYAARQKLLSEEDLPHIPRPDAAPPRDVWLDESQVDALLAFLQREDTDRRMSRLHRFVVLALATAARKNAIESLDWPQVEWHTGLIRYDLQVIRQTKKRKVAVPIADWLEAPLQRMAEERLRDSRWVLDHPGSIRSTFGYGMQRVATATGDKAYLSLTPHALRHTAATLMLRAGTTLWQVAGILGDNPQTVAQTYGHHAAGHLKQAADSWKPVRQAQEGE